jgi:hypothetical protein
MLEKNLFIHTFGWLDSDIHCLAQLNAFYCYAAYLELCGNITEKEKLEFQEYITVIYQNYYSKVNNMGPEMLLFKQFPLWKINEENES